MGSLDLYRAHPHLSATLQPASSLGTNLTRGDSRLSRDRKQAKKRYAALSGEVFSRERARFTPRAERSSWSCVYYIETGAHARTLTHGYAHTRNSRRAGHTRIFRSRGSLAIASCIYARRVLRLRSLRAIPSRPPARTCGRRRHCERCTMQCCVTCTLTYPHEDRAAICATFPILLHCATSRRTLHVDAPPVVLSERQTNVASQRHALSPHDHVTGQ